MIINLYKPIFSNTDSLYMVNNEYEERCVLYKGISVPQEGSLVGLLVDGVVQPKSGQFD